MSERTQRTLLPVVIGISQLLIDTSRILATEQSQNVQRNPTDRPPWGWLLGTADGLEVHSLDRRQRQGTQVAPDSRRVLIVERQHGEQWGLVVDQIGDRLEVAHEAILPIEPRPLHEPYTSVVHTPEGPRLLLDVDRLHPNVVASEQPTSPTDVATAAISTTSSPRMVWVSMDRQKRYILGLSASQVVKVCVHLPIAPALDSTRPLQGFVIYDDAPVPVVDCARPLGLSSTRHPEQRILIVRGTRSLLRVALPIGDDLRTVELPVASRPQAADARQARWTRGIFEVEDGLLIVPDIDALGS